MEPNEWFTQDEAARFLGGIASTTLQWWRTKGRGPKYTKIGRKVLYRRADLEAFIAAGAREPEAA